jgi:hypothetical protein
MGHHEQQISTPGSVAGATARACMDFVLPITMSITSKQKPQTAVGDKRH